MLPFTKRPGKGEESSDLVVKDDLSAPKAPSVPPPASSSRPTSLRNVAGFPGEPIRFPVDDSWRQVDAKPAADAR